MTLKLDENQQKAIEHFQGPALVVAGPGSGKTTVIKERILHLIREHNVDPECILAIAFTNAAADEMNERLSSESALNGNRPKICTIHVFGKDLIKAHYKQAGFAHEPNNIWDDEKIGEIINREKSRLRGENEERSVAIYKIEDKTTYQCYIGQTINPNRRRKEHFDCSSNRRLREAIQQKGEKAFDFTYEWVPGRRADHEETYRINSYRKRAAVNLNKAHQQIDKENSNTPIIIYKIESPNTVTCYFGQTADLESIDKPEGFEVIGEEDTWDQASKRIELEIEKHKNWAVFNDEDPLHARDSTRRRIEVFCKYFNVSYDEVLEHTQKFEHEMRKFDGMNENIVKEKSKVYTEKFKPAEISDPILRAFAKRYEDHKTKAKAIDFLDMLILSANMLEKYPELLHEYRNRYYYVFVDEFQDISPIDFRLIKLFPKNLFAVGDDDQAIYGFRGGDSQIMQDKFGKQANVVNYEITRNYRSTSSIVKYARSLILYNNPQRFSKNLQAENSAQSRVEVLKTSRDTVENTLLNELFPIVTTCETHFKENTLDLDNSLLQELTTPQEIGILARNWYEVNPIQTRLNAILRNKGFQVRWSDSDDQEKRKLIMRRGQKEIVVSTIHSAKGREWEKVILLVNTMTYGRKVSLPDERNDLEDERRLFYVAVTRAKRELVVLNGGNCRFVSEFQNVRPIEIVETIESQIKKKLQAVSQKALETLKLKFKKEVEKEFAAILKQSDELNRSRGDIAEAENASEQMRADLPKQLKVANENLLEGLVPILDGFESQIKNLSAITESNNGLDNLTVFAKSVRSTQAQLLDLLKTHQFKPIETIGEIFNPTYHEKVSSDIYSDEVPAGRIAREEKRGYLFQDQVVRKGQVTISKRKQQADVFLSQDFAQPIRFITYAGFCDLRGIETFKDGVKGLDSQSKERQLPNLNVLFAFPKDDMAILKSHINKKPKIVNQNLQPIELISERYHIADEVLKSLIVKRDAIESDNQAFLVQLVTRSGHVLIGFLWDFDEDFLYMNMNKKVVIIYRAGILKLEKIWNKIAKAYKKGTTIKGHVTTQTKNGLRVEFRLLHGFLPKSQVELKAVRNLDSYVGKTLKMKITKLSKTNNSIVLSRRVWLEERKIKLLNTLEIGQSVTGVVKNITDFGAFVDLGGVDGLLHKSEIAWKRINHPSAVVSIDEEIEVKVIQFDRENEEVSLSLKRMTSNPWENIEYKYPIGSKVSGVVVNIVDYGAFVQLEEGIVGLIHVSEMPLVLNNVSPLDLLSENDELEVTVLRIFKDSQRISLSIT